MIRQFHNLLRADDGRPANRAASCRLWHCLLSVTALMRILVLIIGIIAAVQPALAQDETVYDYQVKAAFLVNFPKYVDWPSVAVRQGSPITVAVFGDDNVADAFAAMIGDRRTIEGHPLVLKRISREDEISGGNFQVLFIAASERSRIPAILERIRGTSILTVGETDDFLDQGGTINLVHRSRKIRLQVNLDAAKQANLKISSRLLVAADTVKGTAN